MNEPEFTITVPRTLWEAIAEPCGENFADHALWGASLAGGKLTTHTTGAFRRLRDSSLAMSTLKALNIEVVRGQFREGIRSLKDAHPELFSETTRKRKGEYW